jgi:hypothetical protein
MPIVKISTGIDAIRKLRSVHLYYLGIMVRNKSILSLTNQTLSDQVLFLAGCFATKSEPERLYMFLRLFQQGLYKEHHETIHASPSAFSM